VIAALATLVIVLLARPVKDAWLNVLDRVFYRDRYDYRRALVAFARDLNSDLDIVRLSQRLVSRIVETLVVDRMALMLAPGEGDDEPRGDFTSIGDYGFTAPVPALSRSTIRSWRRDSRPRKSRRGAMPASTTSCRASSRGGRLQCSRSAARKPTSRSTARISACSPPWPARWRRRSKTAASIVSCI
jgi:hypothetical protein